MRKNTDITQLLSHSANRSEEIILCSCFFKRIYNVCVSRPHCVLHSVWKVLQTVHLDRFRMFLGKKVRCRFQNNDIEHQIIQGALSYVCGRAASCLSLELEAVPQSRCGGEWTATPFESGLQQPLMYREILHKLAM